MEKHKYQPKTVHREAEQVKFRKRFNAKRLARINELIVAAEAAHKTTQKGGGEDKKTTSVRETELKVLK